MKAAVITADPQSEYYTPEQCYITELSCPPRDEEMSIARARVEPGVTTLLHRLDGIDERLFIVAGTGRVEVGDLPPADVSPQDVVLIPRGTSQRITNTGEDDLVFVCVCTPPFEPGCYEDLEERP